VRILLARPGRIASLRGIDGQVVCQSGGTQYNMTTRGLLRDLLRHLNQAWAQYTGADRFAGDLWQAAVLGLHVNSSRRWTERDGLIYDNDSDLR
jgi:hypothetical protein